MRIRSHPLVIAPGGPLVFPDPSRADGEGLVAVGGDLSVDRLLLAYARGIFPWYDRGLPPLWWSPDPRAIIERERLHVSRSMRRVLRQGGYRLSFDKAFRQVMRACSERREGGTWIMPEMIEAYVRLHALGHAHSFEVWDEGELVGGLYGVARGALFAAESMFHRRTNASKVALIASVIGCFRAGVELYDVQFPTAHLLSMGAHVIRRTEYLGRLELAAEKSADWSSLQALDRTAELLENGAGAAADAR
jgi:leucyl/phenylalanyl-tRNA---protein transferase